MKRTRHEREEGLLARQLRFRGQLAQVCLRVVEEPGERRRVEHRRRRRRAVGNARSLTGGARNKNIASARALHLRRRL